MLRREIKKDTKIWDAIGLFHYSIPGLFIFAQFFLGTLVAVVIYVSNCIWSLKNDNLRSCKDERKMEGQQKKGFDICCSCMVFLQELMFNFLVAYIPFGSETWATTFYS